uniref:UDP-N-acetylglucosamine diphosphorylase n=1 Tax=Panagrellus redivivus TaxID=6233 RepID=A0A7E4URP5_PANRE
MDGLTPNQTHIRDAAKYLSSDKCKNFDEYLKQFDWKEIDARWREAQDFAKSQEAQDEIDYDRIPDKRRFSYEDLKDANHNTGRYVIKKGYVCVVTLAGGQASRLGADVPKGLYPLDLGFENPLHCTLLYHQACQYKRLLMSLKEPTLYWIIMTSASTDAAIREGMTKICEDINLSMTDISFIVQKEIPCYDLNGQVILDGDRIKTAPNGNGGFFEAIKPELPRLAQKDVQFFHVYCVDNILCYLGDPRFIGFCIDNGADCAAKVVQRENPEEKMGVVVSAPRKFESFNPQIDYYLQNLKTRFLEREVRVLEYSEMTKEQAERAEPFTPVELTFCDGNIANHFFDIDFLSAVCSYDLPYHIAKKNIKHFSLKENKEIVTAGVKLERFIFDVFPFACNFLSYEVDRELEFAPLKNPDSAGVDCPSTCRDALINAHSLFMSWSCMTKKILLDQYGPHFISKYGIISPLLSYLGENLEVITENKLGVINPVGAFTVNV